MPYSAPRHGDTMQVRVYIQASFASAINGLESTVSGSGRFTAEKRISVSIVEGAWLWAPASVLT
jgi:hypothetical protein